MLLVVILVLLLLMMVMLLDAKETITAVDAAGDHVISIVSTDESGCFLLRIYSAESTLLF